MPSSPLSSQVSTATPAPAILATATPIPTIVPVLATPIPSNTPFVGMQLEALERANVRSAPDVNSERLGRNCEWRILSGARKVFSLDPV